MNDRDFIRARVRYTAIGALAALAIGGAILGTTALAAKPSAHAAAANCAATKDLASPAPNKAGTPAPPVRPQAFLNDVRQLVDNGTITAAQARTVDREIVAGRVDTDTLTAGGFTQAQLDAVQQALTSTKRALAAAVPRSQK